MRIKRCKHCHEPLVCATCGKAWTTTKTCRKTTTGIALTPEEREKLKALAAEAGVSVSQYVCEQLVHRKGKGDSK